jgi:hypothetical protein
MPGDEKNMPPFPAYELGMNFLLLGLCLHNKNNNKPSYNVYPEHVFLMSARTPS